MVSKTTGDKTASQGNECRVRGISVQNNENKIGEKIERKLVRRRIHENLDTVGICRRKREEKE